MLKIACKVQKSCAAGAVPQTLLGKIMMLPRVQSQLNPNNSHSPLKSTSPLPSVSNISITRWTRGFCWSSGSDMNSSTLSDPDLSRSSFLNRLPSLFISSISTANITHQHCMLFIFLFNVSNILINRSTDKTCSVKTPGKPKQTLMTKHPCNTTKTYTQ